ncbi:LURP-one-related family protein [Streptacidiphilus sp. ASG 303]|uniref:LURP-one-related/scramblase family protein n=1 Tax=Streptacidiphilus sp. ASG 303 TaxID=2896847 RepID=UPI001E4EEE52|nr:LURP-one-related family protein [Streptacidiphilus sp. ASG 303]MCD0482156.1 LURP-one-related family protein [Streptacidiphilus sp. ASG 303]
MKYLVRERIFGIGDDFWVETENGEKAFLVDGKALRLRETFELKDPSGLVVAVIRKKVLSVRDAMKVEDANGETTATVRKKMFTPFHDKYRVELADGAEWEVHGDFLDKEYDIEADGGRVARISRKWFRVRDTYAVDVAAGSDAALVLAVAVCVDRLSAAEHGEGDDD